MLITSHISEPGTSYFLGLVITDGSIYINRENPNKGKVSVELKHEDKSLLEELQKITPCPSQISVRTRTTNYSKDYSSAVWCCSRKEMRDWLRIVGAPFGRKSDKICLISGVSQADFWRGVLDGDGSLGFTKDGLPFVSLVTSSENLRDDYLNYVYSLTGRRFNTQRNTRDDVYNIVILKEDAVSLINTLYADEGCLCLRRKQAVAEQIKTWSRPQNMKIINRNEWSVEQDRIVLERSCSEAMSILNRTKASISCRKRRLKQEGFPQNEKLGYNNACKR